MSLPVKILIALVIIVLGIAALVIRSLSKREKDSKPPLTKTPTPAPRKAAADKETADRAADRAADDQRQQWERWYSRAQRLEEEMTLLCGGKTGMVVLRDRFLEAFGTPLAEEYRESFMIKQRRLKETYDEYCTLKRKIEGSPQNAGRHIGPLRDEALYVELINEKLSDEKTNQ